MKAPKLTIKNILFAIFLLLIIIPTTRQFIQIQLQKGLALFSPGIESVEDRAVITDYNWQLVDINGNAYNFRQAENKIVLISFWATWCPPCIAEMPSMQKLHDDYEGKIEFVFISNEKPEVITSFLQKNNYTFNGYSPLEVPTNTLFKVNSIPRTFLIDQKGSIVIDKNGAANWNSDTVRETIDQLLQL